MSRAVAGEENSADTLRNFNRHTGSLLKRHGNTWWRADHSGKDPTKGARGTSAKNDDVDIVWQLNRTESGAVADGPTPARVGAGAYRRHHRHEPAAPHHRGAYLAARHRRAGSGP